VKVKALAAAVAAVALSGFMYGVTSSAEAAERRQAASGIASHYSHAGRKTANGERANPRGMTAAHRTLPFGTRVRVTNKRNGRSVVVRINDRGPFIRGRVIDLTTNAARAIGFTGLAPVSLQVVN
jgi:rare lipoprotein A